MFFERNKKFTICLLILYSFMGYSAKKALSIAVFCDIIIGKYRMAIEVACEGKMKIKKIIPLVLTGMAVAVLTGCSDDLAAKKQEDQNKTMEYWLDLSKDTEAALNIDTIYPGVSVMGIELGGMTLEEASNLIKQEINEQILTHEVVLVYGEKEWTFTFEDLGVSADADVIAQRAFEMGRSGDLRQRSLFVADLETEEEAMQIDTAFDVEKLTAIVESLSEEIKQEPIEAELSRTNGEFVIKPEKNGVALDVEKTVLDIQSVLQSGENNRKVELLVKEVKPEITEELLANVKDKIGSGATYYSASNSDREANLIVGASKLNGMVVMPNEIVSFNTMVAPITAENGYKAANVIQGDEYVLDLGGGLCQVSTTLYNAVIQAELEVIERDCHAFPSDYVTMGLDAAVAQGYIDFQFRNDSGYPIYISMWCGGGEIGAAIYGKEIHDASRKISFDYVITDVIEKPKAKEVEDPKLKPGERVVEVAGHTGYTVDTYKTVTENGESYTEWFSTSYYMASADKVRIGPKKAASNESSTKPAVPENSAGNTETSAPVQESSPSQESSSQDSAPTIEDSEAIVDTPNQESSAGQESAVDQNLTVAQ